MKSCCSLLALALASVAPHAASAQPSPLVLGDLHREVVRASPHAAAARARARAAEARVPGAKLPPDPQLELGFMNYSLPSLAPMDPLGMTQLQLMQMLPLGGKLGLSGRVAEAQRAAQRARAADVEWEVRSQVAMAFYDLYQADQGLVVARETIRLLQDARATAEAMYRVGEGRQADVLRAQVAIARMTEDTLRMRAMRSTMVARLDALLDRAQDADVGAPALPQFPAEVPSLDSLDALARAGRPMLAAGEQALHAAQAGEQLMRREIWPDLQVGVAYGQRAASDGMGTERMGSLMLGASVPIFARSRQLRLREEAAAMRQMALADLASMRAETRGKVGEAYASLTRARRLAALYRGTILPQAEASVASALAAYRVGQVDFMTLLDNRMTVNQYRQALYALEADEGKAWADLEMLTGRELLDPDSIRRTAASGGAQ